MKKRDQTQTRFNISGRLIPAWMMAGLLVVAVSGAATGAFLAGQITGDLGVSISQSLLIQDVDTRTSSGSALDSYDAVSDDKTEFASGIEVLQGDCYFIRLTLDNASDHDLNGSFDIAVPEGVTASMVKASFGSLTPACEVSGAITPGDTAELARTDADTWSFDLNKDADLNTDVDITLILTMADTVVPGFYNLGAMLHQTDR